MAGKEEELRWQGSLNEQVAALEIVRQVLLLRYSLHVRNRLVRALNDTERPIASMIRDALAIDAGIKDPLGVFRLNQLIDQVNRLRAPAWTAGTELVVTDLQELAEAEVADEHSLLVGLFPSLGFLLPGGGVAALALAVPFQGRDTRSWMANARAAEAERIRRSIFAGVAAGEDPATIARRVVGSARAQGRDGTTQTSRNHVDTLVRSAVSHVAAQAKAAFRAANAKLLTTEQFVAVLDSATTKLCRGLNGRRFPLGSGPQPPLHMNCRSCRCVVLPEEIGGPIWEPEVYDAWIRKQPQAVKVELLGATRAARARTNGVDGGSFTDYGARPMTLRQVRAMAARLTGSYQ